MTSMMTLTFAENNSNESGNEKGGRGWFVSRKLALLLVLAVLVALVVVGVAVHYLSPDRSQQYPESQHATPASSVASSAPAPTEKPSKPSNIRLLRNLSPIHYRLKLKPDFYDDNSSSNNNNNSYNNKSSYRFYGEVDIQFRCIETSTSIVLHANQLVIDSYHLFGSTGSELRVNGLEENKDMQWMTFVLDEPLVSRSVYELRMTFSGPLKDDMEGIYWSSYQEDNNTKRIVTSQLEPTGARKVFPCFDEPDFKATFDVIIVRKWNMTSLSNTNITHSTDIADGWVEDYFRRTPAPMSTYLLAFTVCNDFGFIENFTSSGIPFRVYARKSVIENARYALETGIKIQNFFERHFNISYPFPKQDMLAVPEFSAGAMENWGLIIYRETALLYDPNSSSMANKIRVATVISHELAHQWFGNLVTLSWWDDLWLNEGFASYFEYVGVDHAEPTWKIMDHLLTDDMHSVLSFDSLGTSHPINFEIKSTDDISSVFDSIAYSKGASVIRMMQHFLGEETFRSGLTLYLNRHTYSNADHGKLWAALSEQSRLDGNATNVSLRMDPWIKQTGYPVVRVQVSRDNGANTTTTTLSVCQSRFLRDQSGRSDSKAELIWPIPFTYVLSTNPNWMNVGVRWIDKKHENIILDNNAAGIDRWNASESWVIGNVGQYGYYRVNYSIENWMSLIRQLNNNHLVIPVKNRAQIIDDAFEIGRAGLVDQLIGMQMTSYLDREREYIVWMTAIDNIIYVSTMLDRSSGYGELEEYILKKLIPVYNDIGWEIRANDSADDRLLRSTALQWSCFYGHQPCLTKATEIFRDWMNINKSIPGDLKSTVYCTGIREGGRIEWDFAFKAYSLSDIADEKSRLIYAMSCSRTPWILRRYLKYIWEKLRKQDAPLAFSHIARNPVGREVVWSYFRRQWKEIMERYGKGVFLLSRMITTVTEAFNTNAELEQLKDFWNSSSTNMGVGTFTYEQAIEKTQLNIRWMKENEENISDWLKNQNNR